MPNGLESYHVQSMLWLPETSPANRDNPNAESVVRIELETRLEGAPELGRGPSVVATLLVPCSGDTALREVRALARKALVTALRDLAKAVETEVTEDGSDVPVFVPPIE